MKLNTIGKIAIGTGLVFFSGLAGASQTACSNANTTLRVVKWMDDGKVRPRADVIIGLEYYVLMGKTVASRAWYEGGRDIPSFKDFEAKAGVETPVTVPHNDSRFSDDDTFYTETLTLSRPSGQPLSPQYPASVTETVFCHSWNDR